MSHTKSNAAAMSVASNSTLILIKLVAGLLTGSISLIAEAIHSTMDLVAAIIAFLSVRISDKPADEQHEFGHGKMENISGVVEAILIFVAALIIIYEAIERLITRTTLHSVNIGIGIMALAIVVNVVVSRHLMKVSKNTDSLALEADAKHLTTDVMTMGGVLAGLTIVRITGLSIFDPITAIAVALLIVKASYDIMIKSFGGLVDARLPKVEEEQIVSSITEHTNQLVGFHELRTRKAGSQRFIDVHLVLPRNASLENAHRMCDHLELDIKGKLPNSSVVIHVEPCDTGCHECLVVCTLRRGNN